MYYGLSYREGLPWCVYFGRYRQKPPWEHRGRICPFHLLVYVISGDAVFRLQDNVYVVSEGDVILIPQNTYYTVETKTFCEYYFFQFKGNFHACRTLPGMLISNWGFGYSEEPNEETAESGVACYLTTYMHVPDYKNQLSPYCAKLHHYLHIPVPEAEYEFQLTFSQILLELSKCLRNEIEPANASLLSKIIYYIQ
ncbi:MAG: AraC family ligand binding domain-containing protein, partial [Eubacteriales bacterium]